MPLRGRHRRLALRALLLLGAVAVAACGKPSDYAETLHEDVAARIRKPFVPGLKHWTLVVIVWTSMLAFLLALFVVVTGEPGE